MSRRHTGQPSRSKDEGKEMQSEKPAEWNYAELDVGILSSSSVG